MLLSKLGKLAKHSVIAEREREGGGGRKGEGGREGGREGEREGEREEGSVREMHVSEIYM